jgi:hypothetical protein
MLVHFGSVDRRKNKHITKLSVDSSKDISYDKPVRSRTLVVLVRAILRGANSIKCDGTLDGAINTNACRVYHIFLVFRQLDHLNSLSKSAGRFSISG